MASRRRGEGGHAPLFVPAGRAPPRPGLRGDTDLGLWGPDTITWRVHADPLAGVALLRGMALQVLDPAVPPDPGRDTWDRLTGGLKYLGVLTYGSALSALTAAARRRAGSLRHAAQLGAEGEDGDQMLWAHCCWVGSLLDVVRRGGLALAPREQDRYLREQVTAAVLLGVDPGEVPADRAALVRYLHRRRDRLDTTPQSQDLAEDLLAARFPDAAAARTGSSSSSSSAAATTGGLALASLPGWARSLYRLPRDAGPASLGPAATTVALHSLRDSMLRT